MNPRVLQIPGSLIRQIAAKRRPTSINLGLGEPTLSPTRAHLDAAVDYVARHGLRYSPNAGDPALRDAIAGYYAYPEMDRGANVCVTVGSQEAMYVTIKTLLDPAKDELLVVEPAFPSYVKMARLEGVDVRTVAMSDAKDFAFDASRIAAAIGKRTRAVLICSPCNPTGRIMRGQQGELLVKVLSERAGRPIWLIHDEIYREQTFVDDAVEFARIYPHTIVTNSVSKSNALTGLRLGWIIGPQQFVDQAIKTHAWITSCADTFAQAVALNIFQTPGAIAEHAEWYRRQRDGVRTILDAGGLRALPIDGSFYACVQLPPGVVSVDAAVALIEKSDVLTIPGSVFGTCFEGWLRLSWVAPLEQVHEGVARIAEFCRIATL
ncbi:MAG TPA: pyridoxal phosphate-dependent aminotransferase [Verrucomicrobiae bacterium]|jgi:aminotransferase|nr:pyridoxal phosphate-dependent aminotransferase [Verrucomicrobiae bacterium]